MKKIIQICAVLLVMLTMLACTKDNSPNDEPGIILKVGDAYQGGIIFYILKVGDDGYDAKVTHGLIAATEDQDAVYWSLDENQYKSVSGTLTIIGSGSSNTDLIIKQNGKGITYAAGLARLYRGGGYKDWYLPSKDELKELFKAKDKVGGFSTNAYWYSSEYDATNARGQNFPIGYQGYYFKYYLNRVRAIRSF